MSRFTAFVLTATSAVALATAVTPTAAPSAPTPDDASVTVGGTLNRGGDGWCC